jgi:thioredoxin 1
MSAPVAVTAATFSTDVGPSAVPVVLDFWAPWCGPCKSMSPVLDGLAARFDGKVKVGKVNVDEEQALAAAFGIQSIPTLAVIQGGEIVHMEVGFRGEAAVTQIFEALAR